jgi:hypothetical protein
MAQMKPFLGLSVNWKLFMILLIYYEKQSVLVCWAILSTNFKDFYEDINLFLPEVFINDWN